MSGLTYEQEINTETNVHFAYKRINHLREILAQVQAKESCEIPDEIINKIRYEIKKQKKDVTKITNDKIKQYLKTLNYSKYYEHTQQITHIITGKPPPVITPELTEKLITMFMEIQEPFNKLKKDDQKNFFTYNYILYKFCELLGETETMQLFTLLKSRNKLFARDSLWKQICKYKGWPFYPSI
jgi:hypothetical protein